MTPSAGRIFPPGALHWNKSNAHHDHDVHSLACARRHGCGCANRFPIRRATRPADFRTALRHLSCGKHHHGGCAQDAQPGPVDKTLGGKFRQVSQASGVAKRPSEVPLGLQTVLPSNFEARRPRWGQATIATSLSGTRCTRSPCGAIRFGRFPFAWASARNLSRSG